jgi:hypothetical protein
MSVRKYSLAACAIALFLSILACTINLGGPAYPSDRIPISTAAVGDLLNSVATAAAEAEETGEVTLILNETQLTSYLADQLSKQPDPILSDPQVYLRDGQIQVYGTARRSYFLVTVAAFLKAGVDGQGHLAVTLDSADFGPLPVPQGLKDAVTSSIQDAYTGAIGPAATGIRLENVTIAGGTMTVTGRTK